MNGRQFKKLCKRVKTMNGGKWWPQTVKDALTHYTETDSEK
ncbi:hypothetical protein [Vibrio cholerae]|nr:hypothetical protein [Vibrio cholerae]